MLRPLSFVARLGALIVAAGLLAGCYDDDNARLRGFQPIPAKLLAEMESKGMTKSSPILVRVYKQEAELEIWKQTSSGRFALLKTYPICRWSGQLGPKRAEGDRQVPEGFYTITASALNPNSRFYLSYDLGYPNAYDRSLGRSGGDIMVHGACSSRGCFSMTDEQMSEIYAVTREAFAGGQQQFQAQSFPFRFTVANMARHRLNPNMPFWKNLKQGSDNFELTRKPVEVGLCNARYTFNGQGGEPCGVTPSDPSLAAAVAAKMERDAAAVAASGAPAVAAIYDDGGIHPALEAGEGSIPGRDRPYGTVRDPVLVTLDNAGRPATPVDAGRAIQATRSAAETLLASEAALAKRAYRPDPDAITARQRQIIARIFGDSVKLDTVVAAAKPAAAPKPAEEAAQPVFVGLAGTQAPAAPAARPSAAPAAVAPPPAAEEAPFYTRWFGIGG